MTSQKYRNTYTKGVKIIHIYNKMYQRIFCNNVM